MKKMNEETLLAFYELSIENISQGCDLDSLLTTAKDLFGMSVIAVDAGYQLLAFAGEEPVVDPYWNRIKEYGIPSEETIIKHYINDGLLEEISQSNKPIYVNWGVSKAFPQTSGPIYIDGGLEGFISVLFLDERKLDISLRLNELLCQLASIIMRSEKYQLRHTIQPMIENLSRQFFDLEHFPNIQSLLDSNLITISENYMILILKPVARENTMMLSHIKKRLQAAHPNQLYTTKENKLYIFLYQLKENDKIPEVMKVLKEYPIVNGCSEIFSDLSSREKYIQQAELALEYGLVNQQAPSIYSYTEQFGEILLHNLDATIIPSNLYLPAVLQLADYDKTCESNTLETLATFLFKRNDITKTAEVLHVHRNTLTYRLQKINKLTGLDINDEKTAWYLQLSIACYYRERITSFF